jgi:plasmid stabilization system protein ParE
MRIEILDEAEKDLLHGYAFYERQSQGLGQYFLDSLFSDIESLHIYAGIHAMHFGCHRLLAKRFPFAVYYRIQDKAIQVYAILDCRRDPAWTRNRLG